MPLYQCLVPAGSLDADTRASLAEAITTVHFSVTNVPPRFLHVVFTEYEPTTCYTGGRPSTLSVISGTIRSGFEIEIRAELLNRLSASWSSITGQEAQQILVYLDEVDPTSAMERGMIFPARGEEAVWTRQHTQRIEELQSRD
jgi:phenylpyruvate tautomerase PptA (4-oxalocrotonate tautomerase family)